MYKCLRRRPLWAALLAATAFSAPCAAAGAPALDREVVSTSPSSVDGPLDDTSAPDRVDDPGPAGATPEGEATPPQPSPPAQDPALGDETSAPAPGVDGSLLGPSEGPTERPVTAVPSEAKAAEDADAATVNFYRQLYRPRDNPGRFSAVPRIAYVLLGSQNGAISGRMAGFSVDLGQSWNHFGYGATLTANVGDLSLRADDKVKSVALLGGGPTINLGRLALLQRGYLDLRVGYDFFYAPARSFDTAIAAQSIAPHGPRVQINMGLITFPGRTRRFFQGVGLTVGYQGLVGSLIGGPTPYTSVLLFGASYWLG